jgi:predicted dehydrogenase
MGTGLAKRMHAREEAAIVAVSDVNAEARAKAAGEFGAKPFEDYRALLKEQGVDAVIIATPNDTHKKIAVAAAKAGKHVFLEKPMALSVADCDAILAAAKAARIKLMVGQVLRLLPPFIKIREMIASGELGEPWGIFVTRFGGGGFGGWRAERKIAGGILYEVHVHELDFMRSVCGDVRAVSAVMGHYANPQMNYEDMALVNLRFKSGAMGSLHASYVAVRGGSYGKILCSDGALDYSWSDSIIRYQKKGGEEQVLDTKALGIEDGVAHEIRAFCEWVLRNVKPPFTGVDGRAAVEMAQAAYLSAKQGVEVRLPLT